MRLTYEMNWMERRKSSDEDINCWIMNINSLTKKKHSDPNIRDTIKPSRILQRQGRDARQGALRR